MQGPSAKGTVISPKKEHHTKNAALTSGPNGSKFPFWVWEFRVTERGVGLDSLQV